MPEVTPQDHEQQEAFDTLDDMLEGREPSSAMGWPGHSAASTTHRKGRGPADETNAAKCLLETLKAKLGTLDHFCKTGMKM